MKNKGLGRGLDAIFESEGTKFGDSAGKMEEISVSLIMPNPKQPRTAFDEDALEELADSIKTLGLIQPITVRKESDTRYIIISGERQKDPVASCVLCSSGTRTKRKHRGTGFNIGVPFE